MYVEVQLQVSDYPVSGIFLDRLVEPSEASEDSCDDNPMLIAHARGVGFPYGHAKECSASIIAEIVPSREDSNTFSIILLQAIADYDKNNSVVDMADNHMIAPKVIKILWKSTHE